MTFRHYTTRSCLVICVKTIVNFVPLKKSYLETLNQYPNKIFNGLSKKFLKLSVQNIEENMSSWDAMFRLQRDESEFSLIFNRMWRHFLLNDSDTKICLVFCPPPASGPKPCGGNKQLLDEVEHDIMNYQSRGLCYLPKPKAEADNTDTRVW